MTELQFGLIGLGAVAVVGVVVYNTWQEYKHRKLAQQVLNVRHTDVLLDGSEACATSVAYPEREPQADPEPGLKFSPEDDLPPVTIEKTLMSVSANERIEPVFRHDSKPQGFAVEPGTSAPDAKPVPLSEPVIEVLSVHNPDETKNMKDAAEPYHLLSPVIDFVVAFEAVEPAPAYQILEAQRDALARIRKPVHWIGYNESSREWEPIIDDGESEYRSIRVGLQLVDRQGPVADGELSVFHMAMQDMADELMAMADMPPRQPALDAAVKLDEFCASVDIQIGINVISQGQVFPGTKLRALAEAAGMVIDGEGRFVRCDDDGNVLYVLLNQEASGFSAESMKTMSTHGITFLLDVPRVSHGERVFNQMVDLARRFADVLRGALVDDNRRPLSEGALEPIRRQVGQYQAMMAAQSLPAGGSLARRLFS
jgi:FtsZ-interacting cell division protein ZipA